jgi:UDP-3-O-[3-hydroxymyristoyl] glucosamine N-acyltransferase
MKLSELAEKTFAVVEQADEDLEITGASGLDIAESGQVTFLANPKYTPQIKTTRATAIFLNETTEAARDDIAVLRAKDAYLAYTRALKIFNPEPEIISFIHPSAVIHDTANVAKSAYISANVVIGANCTVAERTKIFPNVTIYDNAKIGANCVIHSGVSIRRLRHFGAWVKWRGRLDNWKSDLWKRKKTTPFDYLRFQSAKINFTKIKLCRCVKSIAV